MTDSFAKIHKRLMAERAAAADVKTVTPSFPAKSTRPAQGIQSRIVILRRREDGTVEERPAAPPFMRQDRKSLVEKVVLPTDYFWRGSLEHLARKAEIESD